MRHQSKSRIKENEANPYATTEDFCKVFIENLDDLYLLSLLLTGDHAKAEACLLAGLEGCIQANRIFRGWAYAWAKRTIIRNAIQALRPHPEYTDSFLPADATKRDGHPANIQNRPLGIESVLALKDFERFIFVMSVLERHSVLECSLLLDCPLRECRNARRRILEQPMDAGFAASSHEVSAMRYSGQVSAVA